MAQAGAHDVLYIILINTGNAVQKGTESRFVGKKLNDLCMVCGRYPGVGNDNGREKGVGCMAYAAAKAADAQLNETIRSFESALVIAVDREAGGMPTGTCELMELQAGNDVNVNVLC